MDKDGVLAETTVEDEIEQNRINKLIEEGEKLYINLQARIVNVEGVTDSEKEEAKRKTKETLTAIRETLSTPIYSQLANDPLYATIRSEVKKSAEELSKLEKNLLQLLDII